MTGRRSFLKLSALLAVGIPLRPLRGLAKPRFIERAAFTMGSIVTIKAYAEDERRCHLAIDKAFSEMKEIDRLMSVFNPSSRVSLINRGAGRGDVAADPRIISVLGEAVKASHRTGGAFDITVEPLMTLYGFRGERAAKSFPRDREISAALAGVGMQNVQIDEGRSTVSLAHASTQIDLGGIAVGYALDRAGTILRGHGITSALINHSGDLLAIGAPPDEESWEVGITDPRDTSAIITTTRIRDEALSTSGNYENVVTLGDRTVGHVLNPHDGKSADAMLSSTVIAPRAVKADAFSTGFFVATPPSPPLPDEPGVKLILVLPDGTLRT